MIYIKRIFDFILKHKIILGINYHRVGDKILNDPFSGLHTVKFNLFKLQIRLINIFFKIVSLKDIEEGNIKSKRASLGGKLRGNVNSDQINIKKTADIDGVLNQKTLSIEEGATLKIKTQTYK